MAYRFKPTNKQGVVPCARRHHHEQGLTADCRQCGTEFKQYHNKHVFCSDVCAWRYRGVATAARTCGDCGNVDIVPSSGRGYVCSACRKFRLNPTRTDIQRRTPPENS